MKQRKIDEIDGAFIIEGNRYRDDRGWFQEIYSTARSFPHFVGQDCQVNLSSSRADVVRGLHVAPFSKLCSCVSGRVYDVVADVRNGSVTYLNWYGVWLDEEDQKFIYIPAGCAHGFFSVQDDTLFLYVQDGTYNPDLEWQVNWMDPSLGVEWPKVKRYIISDRDKKAKFLEDMVRE